LQVRIEQVDPKSLVLLERNARFMRHETFDRLQKNVAADGGLTSVPFCGPVGPRGRTVISGNHRVKAAIAAGIALIYVMVTDDPLSDAQVKAIQIAHNALVGEDDPVVLKEIYEAIDAPAYKEYSGLDDKVLGLLERVGVEPIASAQLEYTTVVFYFLPDEVDRLKHSLATANTAAKEKFAARFTDYDRFMEAIGLAGDSYGVANTATALVLLLDVFDRHLGELAEGFIGEGGEPSRKGTVPAAAALGGYHVPTKTAGLLRRLLDGPQKGGQFQALDEAIRGYLDRPAATETAAAV
jgi:hypothetical protein